MIKTRNSEDHLSKDMILSKIREIDIFSYYCPQFKELGEKFCSTIREDSKPSVCIVEWQGKLLYKDFGHAEHTFDCFAYIMHKYDCTFYEALHIIDNDFGLNLSTFNGASVLYTMGYQGTVTDKKQVAKKVIIIRKRERKWKKRDAEFWSQYLISKRTLTNFEVVPITHYWINENRFSCELSYAYKLGTKFKIYSPHEDVKWVSNTTSKHIQGYNQLPKEGSLCVLTSSLKDVMCLYEMGIPSIALQSEMQMPEQRLIDELSHRFKKLLLFYDNDFTNPENPGQTMAQKICETYSEISNIVLPDEYQVKDLSDCIAKFNSFAEIQTLINQAFT